MDRKTIREIIGLINVDLQKNHTRSVVLGGPLMDGGSDLRAGRTPGCIEITDDQNLMVVRIVDDLIEIVFGDDFVNLIEKTIRCQVNDRLIRLGVRWGFSSLFLRRTGAHRSNGEDLGARHELIMINSL